MKKTYVIFVMICVFFLSNLAVAQEVIITDDPAYITPAAGAMLDVKSTTKGFIVPRMTTAERTGGGYSMPG